MADITYRSSDRREHVHAVNASSSLLVVPGGDGNLNIYVDIPQVELGIGLELLSDMGALVIATLRTLGQLERANEKAEAMHDEKTVWRVAGQEVHEVPLSEPGTWPPGVLDIKTNASLDEPDEPGTPGGRV